jgi:hypothetical protein
MGATFSRRMHYVCKAISTCLKASPPKRLRDEESKKLVPEENNTIDDLEDLCDINVLLEMQDVQTPQQPKPSADITAQSKANNHENTKS